MSKDWQGGLRDVSILHGMVGLLLDEDARPRKRPNKATKKKAKGRRKAARAARRKSRG